MDATQSNKINIFKTDLSYKVTSHKLFFTIRVAIAIVFSRYASDKVRYIVDNFVKLLKINAITQLILSQSSASVVLSIND